MATKAKTSADEKKALERAKRLVAECAKKESFVRGLLARKAFAHKLVHFSCKITNSNAESGGIRLSPKPCTHPYLSARRLLSDGHFIPLDYSKNSNDCEQPSASLVSAALSDASHLGVLEDVREEMRQQISDALAAYFITSIPAVDVRLRQILLPKGGAYVSLTPLGSGGLGSVICAKFREANSIEGVRKVSMIDRDAMPLGGSNFQNVGSTIGGLTPICLHGPRQNPEIRAAFSLYYRGFHFVLPKAATTKYLLFLKRRAADGGPWTSAKRQTESELLKDVAGAVLRKSLYSQSLLARHAKELPSEQPKWAVETRGWLDSSARDFAWREVAARSLSTRFIGHRYVDEKNQPLIAELSDADIKRIQKAFVELL